jgi:hypothetical protein
MITYRLLGLEETKLTQANKEEPNGYLRSVVYHSLDAAAEN